MASSGEVNKPSVMVDEPSSRVSLEGHGAIATTPSTAPWRRRPASKPRSDDAEGDGHHRKRRHVAGLRLAAPIQPRHQPPRHQHAFEMPGEGVD